MIFLHPPYHSIIQYSGSVWGKPHPDDLSHCSSYRDYIDKLNFIIKKLFISLRHGGYLAVLVGDIRTQGTFHSIAADMMTIGTLVSWIVKGQYNCRSSSRTYSGKPFIPIVTEHLLLFKKDEWLFGSVLVSFDPGNYGKKRRYHVFKKSLRTSRKTPKSQEKSIL